MKTIKKVVVINQKGGVGKSTISVNLAYGLAKKKYSTLLIDLDPQAHASCIYKKQVSKEETTSNLFLDKNFNINDIIFNAEINSEQEDNLFIIPSSIHLALVAEQILTQTT